MYNKDYKTIIHKVKDLRRYPGFNPINFTFSENSNYGWERCKFVDNTQQFLDVVNYVV